MKKMKILMVDDHQLVLEAIASRLRDEGVGEIQTATGEEEMIRVIKQNEPDMVLMDVELSGGENGLELSSQLRKDYPSIKIIILSQHLKPAYIQEALNSGVEGYVHKKGAFEDLVEAIRKVSMGANFYPDKVIEKIKGNLLVQFTDREKLILELIRNGMGTQEIATSLNLSESGIYHYKNRIKEKTGEDTIAGQIRFAEENGII